MRKIQVHATQHAYPVYTGKGLLKNIEDYLPKAYSALLIVTDTNVANHYLHVVRHALDKTRTSYFIVEPGEQTKQIDIFYQILTKAYEAGLDRHSAVIALGGGVIGDIAGFASATYMRGIDYIQIPTTILAHDSSIGGKVAINHDKAKNLIGSFHAPAAVIYDVDTLKTLSKKERRSGYAELIKEAFIADPNFLNELLKTDLEHLDDQKMVEHLTTGMSIKQAIVEADEYESGSRAFLNLGHTLGHAIEKESGYGIWTHGEAVAAGILFALYISEIQGAQSIPLEGYIKWLKNNQYQVSLPHQDTQRYIQVMKADKKTTRSVISMVLLEKPGVPIIQPITDADLAEHLQSFYTKINHL